MQNLIRGFVLTILVFVALGFIVVPWILGWAVLGTMLWGG